MFLIVRCGDKICTNYSTCVPIRGEFLCQCPHCTNLLSSNENIPNNLPIKSSDYYTVQVTGSDGILYSSLCELERTSCIMSIYVVARQDGVGCIQEHTTIKPGKENRTFNIRILTITNTLFCDLKSCFVPRIS